MPSKTPKQAKFMRAIAHGWTPSRAKNPPSRAVAQEFVDADRKYSGGFAENRYWVGGLAPMSKVNAGYKGSLANPFREFEEGGDVYRRGGRTRRNGGGSGGTGGLGGLTENPYTAEEQATRDRFLNMDIQPDGVWSTMLHRIQQQNLPPPEPTIAAPTTTYSGPRLAGPRRGGGRRGGGRRGGRGGSGGGGSGGGPGPGGSTTPPRIIPTDPTSYVGAAAAASGAESPLVEQLRQHQAKIAATLGSARGGHVNYYEEGGAVRPGHAEGPNPYEGKGMPASYAQWERKNHIDPPPPPEVAEEVEEEGGIGNWLRGIFTPDPETAIGSGEARGTTEEQLKEMEQAYGGRVGYQAGGLAMAAPAGGVPPWIEPTGTGPGYMEEDTQGYQFGGMAARMGPAMRGMRQLRGRQQGRGGQMPRGGVMGGQYRGAAPGGSGRGFLGRAARGDYGPGTTTRYRDGMPVGGGPAPTGALAQMMQRAQQAQAGAQPGGGGGIAARIRQAQQAQQAQAGGGGGGILARIREAQQQQQQQAGGAQPGGGILARIRAAQQAQQAQAGGAPGGGGQVLGDFGGTMGPDVISDYWGPPGGPGDPRTPRGPLAPGGGPFQPGREGNPNVGRPGYDPIGDMGPITGPGRRPWKQRNRIAPPPGKEPGGGMMYPGGSRTFDERTGGGGIPGGPRVPPNLQGYLQKMRMQNRPPSGPVGGGGGNRVGMADQQGAYARALQRGTGRPPMSRRSGFGRAR